MFPIIFFSCLALPPLESPDLFVRKEFNSRDLALAANYFIIMGPKQASLKLASLGKSTFMDFQRAAGNGNRKGIGFSLNSRIGWMCRILYEPVGIDRLRPPSFGGLWLPTSTMPAASWPHYPLVLSGNTFFVLADGYSLAGKAESISAYIEYCKANGSFRKRLIPVPSKEQALNDYRLLLKSREWKAIEWGDEHASVISAPSEREVSDYILLQVERIPTKAPGANRSR
jgi:hypothetical protein